MDETAAIRSGAFRPRHQLTVAAVSLVVIGSLAVLSAADGSSTGSAFSYFAKAAVFGVVGLAIMLWLGRGGKDGSGGIALAHRYTKILVWAGIAGVIFCWLPTPITPPVNGAKQWISFGAFTIQPSEILKPALVLWLAAALAHEPWRVRSWYDLKPILLMAGGALAVIGKEDLGSTLVTGAIVLTVLFIAGMKLRMVATLIVGAAAGAALMTLAMPERVERFTVFLAPFADRYDAGFQITNGLMAIGDGGVFGHGIGESLQKHIIPEPQTDFILPVIMEEVGLLGATVIMALYLWVINLGLRIARERQDPYERLVAAGLTSILLWQAALNIWAVLGIAPLTGVPLPLISAGGTSEIILLAVVGLLIDIDRRSSVPTSRLVESTEAPPAHASSRLKVPLPSALRSTPPDPQPGELRVVDQRGASIATAEPSVAAASTASDANALPQEAAGTAQAPAARRRGSVARRRRPGAASGGGPNEPRVVEQVGGIEILSDATVRLPGGRIGRPKSPMALPDGRVLMPDCSVVSREEAARLTAAAPQV